MSTSRIPPVLPLLSRAKTRVAVACATLAITGDALAFMPVHADSPTAEKEGRHAARASADGIHIQIGGGYTDSHLVIGRGTTHEKRLDLALTVENITKLSRRLSMLKSVAVMLDPEGQAHTEIDTTRNTAHGGDLKVYTVDGSRPGSVRTISFGGGSGEETIVVNVLGSAVDRELPANPADGGKVIWNFVDQPDSPKWEAITQARGLEQALKGTIFSRAVSAERGGRRGGLAAGSHFDGGGNALMMAGSFSGAAPVVAAPEPSGILAMGGFAGLALLRRHRSPSLMRQ